MFRVLKGTVVSRAGIERILWIVLLCFVFSISFSIAASHVFLTASTILYVFWKLRHDRVFPWFGLMLPAIAYSYCILLSSCFSIHPSISLIDAKNLALFIILPIVYDTIDDLEDVQVIYGVLIFAGVISAGYGLFQFFHSDSHVAFNRIKGFMGHWMTFSGLLMVLNVLLLSQLLFSPRHPRWFYLAFPVLSLGLLLSLTRNAWIGFLAASFVLIAMRRVRWVFAIPAVILLVFLASVILFPAFVANRLTSVFNPNETSNRDRIQMARSGWKIIKDNPLTGVGGEMIRYVYPQYREPDSLFRNNQHLHNNVLQLAAENGILALAAWLWLLIKALTDLIHWKRHSMNHEEKFMIHGTIGVIVAIFVAGMFEYNFGDSEIKMLFLILITIPYAWHKSISVAKKDPEKEVRMGFVAVESST